MIIKIVIITIVCSIYAMAIVSVFKKDKDLEKLKKEMFFKVFQTENERKFSVSAYIDRIENAWIEILQEREKEPKAEFVLWIGLDGLRLNEDGTSEWISRREPKPLDTGVFSQPLNMQNAAHYGCVVGAGACGTGADGTIATGWTVPYDVSMSTRANIEKIIGIRSAFQIQSKMDELNMQMIDLQEKAKHEHLIRMMQVCRCSDSPVYRDMTGMIRRDFLYNIIYKYIYILYYIKSSRKEHEKWD